MLRHFLVQENPPIPSWHQLNTATGHVKANKRSFFYMVFNTMFVLFLATYVILMLGHGSQVTRTQISHDSTVFESTHLDHHVTKLETERFKKLEGYACLSNYEKMNKCLTLLAALMVTVMLAIISMAVIVQLLFEILNGIGHLYMCTHSTQYVCYKSAVHEDDYRNVWFCQFVHVIMSVLFNPMSPLRIFFKFKERQMQEMKDPFSCCSSCDMLQEMTRQCKCIFRFGKHSKHKLQCKAILQSVIDACMTVRGKKLLPLKTKYKMLRFLKVLKKRSCPKLTLLYKHLSELARSSLLTTRNEQERPSCPLKRRTPKSEVYQIELIIQGKSYMIDVCKQAASLNDICLFIDNELGFPSHLFRYIKDGKPLGMYEKVTRPSSVYAYIPRRGGGPDRKIRHATCDMCSKEIRHPNTARTLNKEQLDYVENVMNKNAHTVCNKCRHKINNLLHSYRTEVVHSDPDDQLSKPHSHEQTCYPSTSACNFKSSGPLESSSSLESSVVQNMSFDLGNENNVSKTTCLLAKYFGVSCSNAFCKKIPPNWESVDLAHCFGLDVSSGVTWKNAEEYLCSDHYVPAHLYFLHQQNRYCAICTCSLYGKKSFPVPKESNANMVVGAKLCDSCYQSEVTTGAVTLENKLESTLIILKTTLAHYEELMLSPEKVVQNTFVPEVAVLRVMVAKCQALLTDKAKAFLLVDMYDAYWDQITKIGDFLKKEKAVLSFDFAHFAKNPRWLSSVIRNYCPNIFETHQMSKKEGVLFIMKGCNPLDSLHHLMHSHRVHKIDESAKVKRLQEKLQETEKSGNIDSNFTSLLFQVAKKLNCDHIRKQCIQTAKKYTQDPLQLDSVHLHDLLLDIDPIIWNFLIIITMNISDLNRLSTLDSPIDWSTHNLEFMKTGTEYEHRKFVRLIFLSYTVLFNMYDQCGYPMHLIVAEIVSTHSQSHELIQNLSKLGITVSKATQQRFIQTIVQELQSNGGPAAKVLKDTLTVIPVDNIDKGTPKASVSIKNLDGSMWNGTAYSAINPGPLTLKNEHFAVSDKEQNPLQRNTNRCVHQL
jgi:hypothetical protein